MSPETSKVQAFNGGYFSILNQISCFLNQKIQIEVAYISTQSDYKNSYLSHDFLAWLVVVGSSFELGLFQSSEV
jgi:hypothetical protein